VVRRKWKHPVLGPLVLDASICRRFHRAGLHRPGARCINSSATGPRIVRRVSAAWRRRVTTGQGTTHPRRGLTTASVEDSISAHEPVAHPSVGPALKSFLDRRRLEHVAAKPLEPRPVPTGYPDIGVEVQAIERGRAWAA
jgi:hypothetical protein